MGTAVVLIGLVVVVISVIKKLLKDKAKGKSPCGCNCSECCGGCNNTSK